MIFSPLPQRNDDPLRPVLMQLAIEHGANFTLDHLERAAGIRRLSDIDQLTNQQRSELFDELCTLHELLS